MASTLLIELEHLRNENQKLVQQNECLKATVLKLTNGQKALNISLGSQKYINDKSDTRFPDCNDTCF